MNNDIILQSLTEAFEVLKDSWEYKTEAIVSCIVETELYDGDLAIDMWLYVLREAKKKDEYSRIPLDKTMPLIRDVFYKFRDKHIGNINNWGDNCKYITEHIIKYIEHKEELINLILEDSYNAAYVAKDENDNYMCYFYIPQFICSIFYLNNRKLTKLVIKSLSSNNWLIHTSIGDIIRKTVETAVEVAKYYSNFTISMEQKEVLPLNGWIKCVKMTRKSWYYVSL